MHALRYLVFTVHNLALHYFRLGSLLTGAWKTLIARLNLNVPFLSDFDDF